MKTIGLVFKGAAKKAPAAETVHKCEVCGKVFASKSALAGHKKAHVRGEK